MLTFRPMDTGRLSQPRHCSNSVQLNAFITVAVHRRNCPQWDLMQISLTLLSRMLLVRIGYCDPRQT